MTQEQKAREQALVAKYATLTAAERAELAELLEQV